MRIVPQVYDSSWEAALDGQLDDLYAGVASETASDDESDVAATVVPGPPQGNPMRPVLRTWTAEAAYEYVRLATRQGRSEMYVAITEGDRVEVRLPSVARCAQRIIRRAGTAGTRWMAPGNDA